MLARLAFSIAVHMEPDILLIDEVLSVGDAHFQAKCLARISHLQKDAQVTLVFVSHDTDLLTRVATRGLVLDAGVEVYCGEIRNAVAHYEQL